MLARAPSGACSPVAGARGTEEAEGAEGTEGTTGSGSAVSVIDGPVPSLAGGWLLVGAPIGRRRPGLSRIRRSRSG